ncbi:MAG: transcription antitermination protein NusB [Chlamydiales bacterium]|nr:transcription antitermination protein NusB [Chlamydiales bacterium]
MTCPRKLREHTLQTLFSFSMGGEADPSFLPAAAPRAKEIFALAEQLDEKIGNASEAYAIERIDLLDKNILRLALFELLENTLPRQVVISEALRLARKFSTPEAGSFIHAVLDATLSARTE